MPSICSDESSVMTRFCQASCKKCDIVVLVMIHTALVAPRLKCHSQNWHCSPATNLDVTPNAIPKLWEAVFELWQISHCRSYIAFLVRNEIQETKRPQKIDHENNSGQEWPREIKYMSLNMELQWRSSWHLTAPLSLYECWSWWRFMTSTKMWLKMTYMSHRNY